MALSKPLSGTLSIDTDPVSPLVEHRYRPPFSLGRSLVSEDALAGPEDASRSTQELKEGARIEVARNAEKQTDQRRPEHLNIEKQSSNMGGGTGRGLMDQLQTEIYSRVESMSINKGGDSSYSSLNSGDCSVSSMPSADWEEELETFKGEMPPEIRMGYIDVLILYCEEDRAAAERFKSHLKNEIEVPDGPVETLLYDDAEMQSICGSKIQHLAKGVERSTYVFIFMTKNFIEDKWCEFSSESCLMEAITNPAKQWCVVPVYTEKRNSSFRVPMGLNTLKGINYYNNDKFYRNGVSRLIGDKISVRKLANERHRIKQKKWLEEFKRKQIMLKEEQERIARIEEAKTQQLIDWLERETKRLIRDGILPDFIHHSASESDISSGNTSISHSSSSSSLKPVHTQNPAVAMYFKRLLYQQTIHGCNEQNYSPDKLSIIQQMYGQVSPLTPGSQNHISPPVMNRFQSHSPDLTRHGFFPPVATSASYGQQNPHQVKRSQSQTSADMGPSTQFILHTETGDIQVTVPSVLFESIKDKPENEQQKFVRSYITQMQQAGNQQSPVAESQFQPNPVMSGIEQGSLNRMQGSAGTSVNPSSLQQRNMYNSNFQENVPMLEALYPSMGESQGSRPSVRSGYSSEQGSSYTGMSSRMPSTGHSQAASGQYSRNMDGNTSCPPVTGGNLPNHSLLGSMAAADGGSMSSYPSYRSGGDEVNKNQRTQVTYEQSDSGSDESDEESKIDKKKKSKGTKKKVVHIHKTVIYQPQVVQIGDQNIVHQRDSDDSADSSDGEEKTSDNSDTLATCNKTVDEGGTCTNEKPQMMKVEIKPGSETHGEMPEQPSSAGTNSSCNVDAAPSASPSSAVSDLEPKVGGKHTSETKKLIIDRSIGGSKEEIEEAEEAIPDDFNKEFINNFDSTKIEETLSESVNINSSRSEDKSSSLKRKEMPFDYHIEPKERPVGRAKPDCKERQVGRAKPDCKERPVGRAKPVVAVSPYSPNLIEDNSDDNCDNTDPKTVVESEETVRKKPASGSKGAYGSEQTFVKKVVKHTESHSTSEQIEAEQMQRNVPAQVLTKGAVCSEKTPAKFRNLSHVDPHKLFYQSNVSTAAKKNDIKPNDDLSSLESEVNASGRQEVPLGSDPLTRDPQEEPATQSFIPESSQFTPQLNDNDLEFDMLEDTESPKTATSAFEESGTKLNKSWNKRGSPTGNGKKECVIS